VRVRSISNPANYDVLHQSALSMLLIILLGFSLGCGGKEKKYDTGAVLPLNEGLNSFDVWEKTGFEVDRNVPAGAIKEVTAESGGAGFPEIAESMGWETRNDYPDDVSPDAKVGGKISIRITEYPATMRVEGKDSGTAFQQMMKAACYEKLLGINTTDLEYQPGLATHWKFVRLDDGSQEIWLRLNPEARWQTGQRITSEDVVASWKLKVDEGLKKISDALTYREFSEPEIVSPYIVKTSTNKHSWRQIMSFASELWIYPGHLIAGRTGKQYMDDYQNRPMPGSGRYLIREDKDIRQGNSLTLTRINNYWDKDNPHKIGEWNFGKIKFVVISEDNLAREKVKKGELDVYTVNQAKFWVREIVPERVSQLAMGWLQKQKIFNDQPNGMQGFVFNTRDWPFNDLRVRKAFTLSINREILMDKLFFNQYLHQDSFFPGGTYENPENVKPRFDPEAARALLLDAGWKPDENGVMVDKNGRKFEVVLMSSESPSSERIMTVIQESLAKSGIVLKLKPTTFATRIQMLQDRKFTLYYGAWTGMNFPEPRSSWHSEFALGPDTGNHPGLMDNVVDSLVTVYDVAFDQKQRAGLLRNLDKRLTDAHVLALAWYGPYDRLFYWNKFGKPDWILPRTADYRDLIRIWWYDPDKHQDLRDAIEDHVELERLPEEVNYWD
jgi:microcin C transport system substrate-binding protein